MVLKCIFKQAQMRSHLECELSKYLFVSSSRQMVHSQSLREPLLAPNVNVPEITHRTTRPPNARDVRAILDLIKHYPNADNGSMRDCLLTQHLMQPSTLLNRSRNVLWINASVTFISRAHRLAAGGWWLVSALHADDSSDIYAIICLYIYMFIIHYKMVWEKRIMSP